MTLRSVNLNLLPVLRALLRERSVSRAATTVGLSQPAASRALAQLRDILGDPLLVRAGPSYVLTRRAEALAVEVEQVCRDMEALWRRPVFDPSVEEREFVIASADYAPILLVPLLTPLLRDRAPGISLRFTEWRPDDLVDVRRATDFVLGPAVALAAHLDAGGALTTLFDDDFVTVVGKGHPLADRPADEVEVDAYPHIVFAGGDPRDPAIDAVDSLLGRRPTQVVARVRQFAALPLLALMTGSVVIMPRRLADIMQTQLAIAIVEESRPRTTVRICLAWNRRFDTDPAHAWFRALVVEALTDPATPRDPGRPG